MSQSLPSLHDRQGFAAWKKALHTLAPEQMRTIREFPPSGTGERASWFRHKISAYHIMITSLDDSLLNGLLAHGKLGQPGDPRGLYSAIHAFLSPKPSHTAELVRKVMDVNRFKKPQEQYDIVPYLQMIKISVDYAADDLNPTLTALLLDTLSQSYLYQERVKAYPDDIDWDDIMDDLSGKAKIGESETASKREAPEDTGSNKRVKHED